MGTDHNPARYRQLVRATMVAAIVIGASPLVNVAPASGASPVIGPVVVGPVAAGQPVTVTAPITDPGIDPVKLEVIVGFAAATSTTMLDNGTAGDAVAGDGIFTAIIAGKPTGTLVRHRVTAGSGATGVTSPIKDGKRQYAGFLVNRSAVATQLPVLDWYLAPADAAWLAANRKSKDYVPAVLVVGNEVIDGVQVRNQGGFTSGFQPKPNYKFKLPGQTTVAAPLFTTPVDEFVADADAEDPTYAMSVTAQGLLETAGVPRRQITTARMERNGSFHGVYQLMQELDGTWFDTLGFPVGSLEEGEGGLAHLIDEGSAEALAARWEHEAGPDTGALARLVAAVDRSAGPARADAVVDNFDLPRLIDFLAMSVLLQHFDSQAGNVDLALDAASGRWRVVPNDLDLVLGLRGRTRWNTVIPFPLRPTMTVLYRDPNVQAAVARRVRTLFDASFTTDVIADQIAARQTAMAPDLALDQATWQLPLPNPAGGVIDLRDYLASQRDVVASATASGLLPPSPSEDAVVRISEVLASGTDADLIELANPDPAEAVDVSGWGLTGDVTGVLPGGSVIPPGGRMVVPRSPAGIAARHDGINVAGTLDAPLPISGGVVELRDGTGAIQDQVTYESGGPWPAAGTQGRSLEARTLDEARGSAAGWVVSVAVGGTPGSAGASAQGLDVDVWTGQTETGPQRPVSMRIVVSNHGPGLQQAVVVDGPDPTCDRALGDLDPGRSRTVWCRIASSSLGSPAATVSVRSQQQTSAIGRTLVSTRTWTEPVGLAPQLDAVRLGSGALVSTYRAPTLGQVGSALPWRLEQQFALEDAADVPAAVIEPNGSGQAVLPIAARRGRLRLLVRGMAVSAVSAMTPSLTPRPSPLWPFSSSTALVQRWFTDLAARAPAANETLFWTTVIDGGTSPAVLATYLLGQAPWNNQVDGIVRLYLAHFGRLPDAGGLRYWQSQRRAGVSLAAVSTLFSASAEFAARYEGTSDGAYVDAVYRNVFHREPDPGGRAYWTDLVQRGYPRWALVVVFSDSAEGVALSAHTVAAFDAWFGLRNEVPADAWLAMAVEWLDGGGDPGTLVESARSDDAYGASIG